MDSKAPDAFRTISEVADELDLPQHVLRFWESRFHEIRPMKRGGGRRYYRPDDIDLLRGIRHLLYGEGYTIRGVQRILREQGPKFVQVVWQEGAPQPPHGATEEDDIAEQFGPLPRVLSDEGRSLGGKLAALIGRDLGARRDSESRRDPPMQAAPEPHIDADDRIAHSAPEPMPVSEEVDFPTPEAPASRVSASFTLSREALDKLRGALQELGECRKLIDAAVS